MPPAVPIICPICAEPLQLSGRSYACPNRHNFDLSREGYLSLLHGRSNYQEVGDDKRMIQARVHVHRLPAFQQLAQAVTSLCPAGALPHGILDIGCGEGFFLDHLAHSAVPPAQGIGVDISKEALGQAARRYPGLFFVRTDAAHQPLPFRESSFGLVLSIFAPRPIDEIRRVLRADGAWLIVTANPDHLMELREFLPLAAIGTGKLDAPSSRSFSIVRSDSLIRQHQVARDDLVAIVEMSPSIHRLRREFGEGWMARVPSALGVTFSFSVTVLEPRMIGDQAR